MSIELNGTTGIDFNDGSNQSTAATPYGRKNLIINGDMRIDQRNAGASVTPADGNYTIDRWATIANAANKFSIQQNAGSVTPPVGFSNYLGITSLSAYSVGTGDILGIQQRIEGFNAANLNWGTADAKTVTLSAWVYSSLTGTFGGSLINAAQNYSYPFTYTISSANTWTKISITISGPTSGTWVGATNGVGIQVNFGIGGGSTYSGTAGAWGSQQKYTATGATSVVGTSGATFYITGVQLEVGDAASDFEFMPYDMELQRCQRYYWKGDINSVTGATFNSANSSIQPRCYSPVPLRATPSVTWLSGGTDWRGNSSNAACSTATSSITLDDSGTAIKWTQAYSGGSLVTNSAWHQGSTSILEISAEL